MTDLHQLRLGMPNVIEKGTRQYSRGKLMALDFRGIGPFRALVLCAAILLTGCVSVKSYVDPELPLVGKDAIPATTSRIPVQVQVEFRTNGTLNASGTSAIRPRVIAIASESGLFSEVSSTALDEQTPQLQVIIDNIPEGHPAAKGFGTGLTLGAVGSLVTDRYICTATYTNGAETTSATVKHALHTTVGNKRGPSGLTAVSLQQGGETVIDQLTWNAIKQLADQDAFN